MLMTYLLRILGAQFGPWLMDAQVSEYQMVKFVIFDNNCYGKSVTMLDLLISQQLELAHNTQAGMISVLLQGFQISIF